MGKNSHRLSPLVFPAMCSCLISKCCQVLVIKDGQRLCFSWCIIWDSVWRLSVIAFRWDQTIRLQTVLAASDCCISGCIGCVHIFCTFHWTLCLFMIVYAESNWHPSRMRFGLKSFVVPGETCRKDGRGRLVCSWTGVRNGPSPTQVKL